MTIAAWNGHNDIVKLLLERGGDQTLRQSNGDVPLTLAASKGQIAVCRTLLEAGADPNVEQSNKDTCVPHVCLHPLSCRRCRRCCQITRTRAPIVRAR